MSQQQSYNVYGSQQPVYGSQQPGAQPMVGGVVPGNSQQDDVLLKDPYGQQQQSQFGQQQQSQYNYYNQSQLPQNQGYSQYPQQQPMQAIIIGEHNDGGGGQGYNQDQQDQNLPTNANKCSQPIKMKCPNCTSKVTTFITYEPGFWTIFCCIILGIFLFPCCFIPFLIEDCKDKVHKCPKCKVKVGVKRAFS